MRWKVEGMLNGVDEGIAPLLGLPDDWDGEGDVGLDVGGGTGEGKWTVLWRATVREMIAREQKLGRGAPEDGGAGEMDDGGSRGTPGVGDQEGVVDDENVFDDQEEEQGAVPDDENAYVDQEEEQDEEEGMAADDEGGN